MEQGNPLYRGKAPLEGEEQLQRITLAYERLLDKKSDDVVRLRAQLELRGEEIMALRSRVQELESRLEKNCPDQTLGSIQGGFTFLRSIPLFQSFTEVQLHRLAMGLTEKVFQDGERIITQGDPGEAFFIVQDGEVAVYLATGQEPPRFVTTCVSGDFFGERALLLDEPRSATCIASGKVVCHVLERTHFTATMSGVQDLLGKRLDIYEYGRADDGVQALRKYVQQFRVLLTRMKEGELAVEADQIVTVGGAGTHEQEDATEAEIASVQLQLMELFSTELNMDDVIQRVIGRVGELFDVEETRFYIVDAQAQEIDLHAVEPPSAMSLASNAALPWEGVAARAASTRVIANVDRDDNSEQLLSESQDTRLGVYHRQVLAVPVFAREEFITRATLEDEELSLPAPSLGALRQHSTVKSKVFQQLDVTHTPVVSIIEIVNPRSRVAFGPRQEALLEGVAKQVGGYMEVKMHELRIKKRLAEVELLPNARSKLTVTVTDLFRVPYAFFKRAQHAPVVRLSVVHGPKSLAEPVFVTCSQEGVDTQDVMSENVMKRWRKALYSELEEHFNEITNAAPPAVSTAFSEGAPNASTPETDEAPSIAPAPSAPFLQSRTKRRARKHLRCADFEFDATPVCIDLKIRDLPRAARLLLTLHVSLADAENNTNACGHCIAPLFDVSNVLMHGHQILYLVAGPPGPQLRQPQTNAPRDSPSLRVVVAKPSGRTVVHCDMDDVHVLSGSNTRSAVMRKVGGLSVASQSPNVRSVRPPRRGSHSGMGELLRQHSEDDILRQYDSSQRSSSPVLDAGTAHWQREAEAMEQLEDTESLQPLKQILQQDVLYECSEHERRIVWQHRYFLLRLPKTLPRLLEAVNWARRDAVLEMYRLLSCWTHVDPLTALQLLDVRFPDPKVRAYAVECLNALPDEELSDLMLQLIQVLKFEPNHDTALCRFLLRRAFINPTICGHQLFWLLRSEQNVADDQQRCRILLEEYLRNCGSHRVTLGHQQYVIQKLDDVALQVKAAAPEERSDVLRDALEAVVFPKSFQLPLSPHIECTGVIVSQCRYMRSAKKPLWLTFSQLKRDAPPYQVMFKSGDDLRQDQLVLQVLRIMDRLWKAEGLDLCMSPYGCISTGNMQGMLEIVKNADTIANIVRKEAVGNKKGLLATGKMVREVMSGTDALVNWLYRENSGRSMIAGTGRKRVRGRRGARGNTLNPKEMSLGGSEGLKRSMTLTVGGGAAAEQSKYKTMSRSRTSNADATSSAEAPRTQEMINPLLHGSAFVRAQDNFAMSCAGYCVATWVLGIGDRHNDNIMLSRNGKLFHIDFGHFLGNFKSKFGFKRETAPFVFTQHFERVLGGKDTGERFHIFTDTSLRAFQVLHANANLLMTLFSLMVSCGIPELRDRSDIFWIRQALFLGHSQEEADRLFLEKIDESISCKRTLLNHAVHLIKHG